MALRLVKTTHNNMFAASKSGSATPKDAQFNYVTMLLHGDGTNGAQNNTFLDSSTNNFTITRNGNTTQGTFSPYGSNWSNSFTPNSGVQFPYTSSLTSWWTQDFTMEMWVFNNTNAVSGTNSLPLQFAHGVYNSTSTYWSFGTNASGQLVFYYYNGSANSVTSTTTASLGTWNHIAMVYTNSSGNISLYLNGVSVASATKSGTPQNDATNTVNIGAVQTTYYNGYISNLRVLNGTALYSSTFTPSTTPLTAITNTQLLTCQTNRFKDNSTNNATPTLIGSPSVQRFSPFAPATAYSTSVIGGSGYFDGSGDYLNTPDNSAIDAGTGDFTVEAWVYHSNSASAIEIYFAVYNGGISFYRNASGKLECAQDSIIGLLTGATTVQPNTWNHVALTRSGTTLRIFLNGVQDASTTNSTNFIGGAGWIGASNGPTFYMKGYITDLRMLKGTAQYTSAFTPPTTPLTAITNTSLLLSNTNAGILDNAMMNDLETVGNAQISTSVKKYGTGSMYFDGTGDWMLMPSSPNFAFNSGDFTLEMWAYFTSVANFPTLTDSRVNTSSTAGFNLGLSSAKVQLYTTSQLAIGSTTLSINTWYHIAVCRSGSTLKIFVNGTQDASITNSTNWSDQTFVIGATPSLANTMTGYIDDLRITKGVARYTANFTAPTAAFPNN